MDENIPGAWGLGAPAAPSVKRADPLGWALASLCAGAVAFCATLAPVWRPLPGFGAPPWGLADQLWCGATLLARHAVAGAFKTDAQACASAWAGLSALAQLGVLMRLALASLAACAPAVLMFRGFMEPRDTLIHMRGSVRLSTGESAARLRRKFARASKLRPDHDIAPGVPYPGDMWTKMVLVVGGTGSGKSTFLRPLIQKIIDAGEPALVFDPKGEFTSSFAAPIILAPWDRRSYAWDIGRDMRNVADMRRFAEALVEQSTDPMWSNASRQILVGFMACLQATRGSEWGFSELADMIGLPQLAVARIMKEHLPEAARLVEKPTVTTQGILINLASSCAPIFDLAEAWGDVPEGRRVSFVDWTLGKGRHKQIIMQGHASYPALTRSYARPIVEVVAALAGSVEMRDDATRKRWFLCDECPALGKVNLRLLIEQGRSKGFRCVLACQDFAQLEEIHGDKTVKALTSMVGTILVGRIGPGDTAERLAKAMGVREVERPNVSTSHSGSAGASNRSTTLSFAREQLASYLPSELASRLGVAPNGKGVVMALVTDGNAYELFWPFHAMKRARPEYIPAAWTKGRHAAAGVWAPGSARSANPAVSAQPDGASLEDCPDANTATPTSARGEGAAGADSAQPDDPRRDIVATSPREEGRARPGEPETPA